MPTRTTSTKGSNPRSTRTRERPPGKDWQWVPIHGEQPLVGLRAIADMFCSVDKHWRANEGYDVPDPLPVANWWTRLAR